MKKLNKVYNNMKEQVTTQLHKVNLEGVLGAMGLQLAKHSRGMSLPIVAAFGAGMAFGAGSALLLAPMSGKDLRGKLGELVKRLPHWGAKEASDIDASPELPHEEVVEPDDVMANGVQAAKKTKRASSDGAAV